MADQAQGSDVLQIAFAAALDHWDNMIRVPKRPSANPLEPPTRQQLLPMSPARPLQVEIGHPAIHPAYRADAPVTGEYLLAQIPGIRAKAPFMDAPIRAEGEPARGDLEVTPAAERTAVLPSRQCSSIGKSAGHGSGRAHKTFLTQIALGEIAILVVDSKHERRRQSAVEKRSIYAPGQRPHFGNR